MTNKERKAMLYQALEDAGKKPLKHVNFCKLEDLEALVAEEKKNADPGKTQNKKSPPVVQKNTPESSKPKESSNQKLTDPGWGDEFKSIPTLELTESGWCNELQQSYKKGRYKPATMKEYNALKEFAKK
jgi:hypothetical protein